MTVRSGPRRERWPAYAAAIWAIIFALMSFYWAAGGMVGADTLAHSIQVEAEKREPSFVALLWLTGVLKLGLAAIALAFVQRWGGRIPRKLLLLAGWAAGAFMTIYGLAGVTQALLIETGKIDVPLSMGSDVVRWYLFFWEPIWMLGGLLMLLATRRYQVMTRAR